MSVTVLRCAKCANGSMQSPLFATKFCRLMAPFFGLEVTVPNARFLGRFRYKWLVLAVFQCASSFDISETDREFLGHANAIEHLPQHVIVKFRGIKMNV